jgi:hypothetical protein
MDYQVDLNPILNRSFLGLTLYSKCDIKVAHQIKKLEEKFENSKINKNNSETKKRVKVLNSYIV